MLKIKKVSDVIGKRVYLDSGDLFGDVEELNLLENKIDGWRIRVVGEAIKMLGGARGVIIPHQYVKAIGDVVIISKVAIPSGGDMNEMEEDLGELEV